VHVLVYNKQFIIAYGRYERKNNISYFKLSWTCIVFTRRILLWNHEYVILPLLFEPKDNEVIELLRILSNLHSFNGVEW